ncbi:MAG: thioredoxin domain-containing protein [Elusimicrobiota bacterium]
MKKRSARRIFCGAALSAALIGSVHLARQSRWASALSLPAGRVKGPPGATLTLIEFSDFQCPSCKRATTVADDLLGLYPNDLKIVYKYFPLSQMHAWSKLAAAGAECARAQDKFWPYHDILFDKQEEWSKAQDAKIEFLRYAKDLGLDLTGFEACLADPKTEAIIKTDVAEGERAGLSSTPTFLLGQFRLVGSGQLRRDGARLIEVLKNEKNK